MQSESLVNKQVKVRLAWSEGIGTVYLPSGESFIWPLKDESGETKIDEEVYLVLSSSSILPTQQELAKLVLKEILKPQKGK